MTEKKNEATLFASANPHIEKRINLRKVGSAWVLMLLGVLSVFLAFYVGKTTVPLSITFFILGGIFLLIGIFLYREQRIEWVYTPTGSRVKKETIFFSSKQLPLLKDSFDNENFSLSKGIKSIHNGSVRLEVMKTEDQQFVAAQLSEFEPYAYFPISPIYYLSKEKAGDFHQFLQMSKA